MWIYLSGTDGLPPIVLYDYRPGRGSEHPTGFLAGFKGMVYCDGYSAYGKLSDVILVCCLAHVRRKFFDAIPASRRKAFRLLDINSEEEISQSDITLDDSLIPAEKGVVYCNRIFYKERLYKNMDPESRKQERLYPLGRVLDVARNTESGRRKQAGEGGELCPKSQGNPDELSA